MESEKLKISFFFKFSDKIRGGSYTVRRKNGFLGKASNDKKIIFAFRTAEEEEEVGTWTSKYPNDFCA